MALNYHDAFIPVITVNKNTKNSFISKQFFTQKYQLKKQNRLVNSLKANKGFLNMRYSSNYNRLDAIEIIKKDIEQSDTNWKTSIQKLPSSYRRVLSLLIFGSFFLSGWFLTPSKNRYISLGVSLFSSGLAFILNNKINSKNTLGVKYKILENIISSIEFSDFKKEIPKIESDFNITPEEIKNEILDIYKRYIQIFLRDSEIRIEEVLELFKIKNIFNISHQDIGECHIQIARDLYKEYTINLERKTSDTFSLKVDKFLFLSDRIFSLDSSKGYQYELSRLRKIFLLSNEKIINTCLNISSSTYRKIIELSLGKNFYNFEDLTIFQKALGVKDEEKEKLHAEFLKKKISEILLKERKIPEKEKLELQKIQNILKIDESEFQKILYQLTQPFFQNDTFDIISKCTFENDLKTIEKLSNSFLIRKNELLIPSNEIKTEISLALKKVTENVINSIINNLRFQKTQLVIEGIETLLKLEENSLNVLKLLNIESQEDLKLIYNNGAFNDAGMNFKFQDIKQIFLTFIEICLENLPISQKNEVKISKLKKIFSISDTEYNNLYNSLVEPIYKSRLTKSIQEKKFNKIEVEEILKLQNSLNIKIESVFSIKLELYRNFLQKFIENENIFSIESLDYLNQIRIFLSLKWSDVQEIHDNLNESSYTKAIAEAMGASGFISKNYWEGLEKLRKRLYLTETKARNIFYKVSQEKLKQLFEQAVIENKRKAQLKNEGKDVKEDSNGGTALGIEAGSVSGNELSNLIDFYVRNKIYIEKDIPLNNSANSTLKGMNGRLETRFVTSIKKDYEYPVNINGLFEKKIVSEMYKQYLVECFSSKLQNEKRKMFSNLDKLGPILGMDYVEINSIHSNVGALVYKQFLAQALNKGYIDKSETAFLTSIQNTLSMDGRTCSELIKDAKKNRIAIFVENIFSKPKVNPDSVSEMREMAVRLGVNLQSDLSLSNDQCIKLFRVEIDSNIEKGLITSENQNLVEEIRLAFGLQKETVKKVIIESITSRCEGHLINAIASLRKNSVEESLKEVEKLLNFGNLIPIKIQSTFASKKEKEQLLSLFQSVYEQTKSNENKQGRIDLLKLMLNI